jgi:HEAT repeat protein
MKPSIQDYLDWVIGEDIELRQEAKLYLGGLTPDDDVSVHPLIDALRSSNDDLAFWAVVALNRLKGKSIDAIPSLLELCVKHEAIGVRQAVITALASIAPETPNVREAVFAAFSDESPFVRREALQAAISLVNLAEADLTAIGEMKGDPDEAVSRWSEIALRNIAISRNKEES